MRSNRRMYRRCSACDAVRSAAEFKRPAGAMSFGAPWRVRCPACGHVALTKDFPPAEKPAQSKEPESGG